MAVSSLEESFVQFLSIYMKTAMERETEAVVKNWLEGFLSQVFLGNFCSISHKNFVNSTNE